MSNHIDPSARRRERLSRTRTIRHRVIGGAVALFVAAWLMIAVVLVSGHDPALASRSAATSTVAAQTTTQITTRSSGSQPSSSSGSQPSSSSGSGSFVTRSS